MTQQIINVGVAPNDGLGDPLRTGGTKINGNFTEIYNAVLSNINKGDITISGTGITWTINNAAVNYAKMQSTVGANVVLGRLSSAGILGELTGTQLTTILDVFTNVLKGLVPASGGGITNFLCSDGTWKVPSTSSGAPHQRSITSGPATVLGTDQILNYNTTSPSGLTLPLSGTRNGLPLTVKDVGGQFFAHPLVVNATSPEIIEPPAGGSFIMNQQNQAQTFVPFADGVNTGWFLL